ncbi:MAG: heme-binding protein [Phycisphaerales bacterium]
MLVTITIALAVSLASPEGAGGQTASGATTPEPAKEIGFGAVRTPGQVTRVGGDREATLEIRDGVYHAGSSSIESPLPDGYAEPTPPGAIDIKTYPSVRRVEWESSATTGQVAMNNGFWPLFNHIKSRDIPMTSPVEMDYVGVYPDPATSLTPVAGGAWTMSFLYRAPKLGPVGTDKSLKIVDTPEVTVASIGVRGPYGMKVVERGLTSLKEWIDGQSEWEFAGHVRVFHYNGPYVRDANKWSEIQVPVRRKAQSPQPPSSAQSTPSDHR